MKWRLDPPAALHDNLGDDCLLLLNTHQNNAEHVLQQQCKLIDQSVYILFGQRTQ